MCELRNISIMRQTTYDNTLDASRLYPIEEEPEDYHSQHSRGARSHSQKNGNEGGNHGAGGNNICRGERGEAGWNSQSSTITTYATQYSDRFDMNNLAFTAATEAPYHHKGEVIKYDKKKTQSSPIGLVRIKRRKFDEDGEEDGNDTIGTIRTDGTTTTATNNTVIPAIGGTLPASNGDGDKWDHNYYYNDYGTATKDPVQLYEWCHRRWDYTAKMRRQERQRRQQEREERRRQRRRCCACVCM